MQQEQKAEKERPDLEHGKLPDPQAKAISCLFDQVRALEQKVAELNEKLEKAEEKPKRATARARSTSKTTTAKTAKKSASASRSRKVEKGEA
jgi:TolA-binding protein